MNNAISNNAYGILGLLPNSTQSDFSKRIKEIEKLLQIDETPKYPFDFGYYDKERTLSNCKSATQKISNSKNQIINYFFRIYVENDEQERLLNYIDGGLDFNKISTYYQRIESKSFIHKKNTAVLLSLLLMSQKSIANLEEVYSLNIEIWKEILDSEKSLKDFKKIYLLDDEIGVDESVFEGMDSMLLSELTTIFSDISNYQQEPKILAAFIRKFNLADFNIGQVEDVHKNIYKSIQILKNLNISQDGVFDSNEKSVLKNCLESFQAEFNKLKDLNLYEHERTIVLRDMVASAIRLQMIDLFNNLYEDEEAYKLTKFALQIAGTESVKSRLEEELKFIEEYAKPEEIIEIDKKKLTIYKHYFEVNGKKISFDEVQSVRYLLETFSVNFIETSKIYNFEIGTKNNHFGFIKNAGWLSDRQKIKDDYSKLLGFANFLAAIIAEKCYAKLMDGQTLRIGNLYLTKDYYYIRKWSGNDKVVKIRQVLREPDLKNGNVIVYNNFGNPFYEFSFGTSNSLVLILLIKMLKDRSECSDIQAKRASDFYISPNYGLHNFYLEKESEAERRKIFFKDFCKDLFGLICSVVTIAFVIFIILKIF